VHGGGGRVACLSGNETGRFNWRLVYILLKIIIFVYKPHS
jgi:hypothetical protein